MSRHTLNMLPHYILYMQNQSVLFSFSSIFASYFNVSLILQGCAATYLTCGEICYVTRVGNFFFYKVKESGKSVKT